MFWALTLSLAGLTAVYLLFCVDPSGKGFLSRLRAIVFTSLPAAFNKVGVMIFGKRFERWTKRVVSYLFKENNCIIMVLYLCLTPGSYFAYNYYGFYKNWAGLGLHPAFVFIGFIMFVVCMYTYIKAALTDPGSINKQNVKEYMDRFGDLHDGILFRKGNVCSSCNIPKPPRSKHCGICRRCVSKFDHHCIWLKSCVGEKNYKWFVGFLLSHSIITFYGFILGLFILKSFVDKKGLWTAQFKNFQTGEVFQATYPIILNYLIGHNPYFIFVVMLCFIMSIALAAFFGYHIYLIKTGFTTNEKIKVGFAEYDFDKAIKNKKNQLRSMLDSDPDAKEKSEQYVAVKEQIMDYQESIEIIKKLSYSRGFSANLKSVINA